MIKRFLYVEDGSVCVDDLEETLDGETKIIVYRQGSHPPILVELEKKEHVRDYNDTKCEEEYEKGQATTKIEHYVAKIIDPELQEKIILMINADLDCLAVKKNQKDNISSIRCWQDHISGKLSLCFQCQFISDKQYVKLTERLYNILDDIYRDKK